MENQAKNFYDIKDFMKIFDNKISRAQLYKQTKNGTIPTVKIGARVFICGWYVDKLLSTGK